MLNRVFVTFTKILKTILESMKVTFQDYGVRDN